MNEPDAFTRARFVNDKIGERFWALRDLHQKASDALWAGWLTSTFTDDEVAVLRSFSLLSPHDEALIAGARTGERQPHSVVLGVVEQVRFGVGGRDE